MKTYKYVLLSIVLLLNVMFVSAQNLADTYKDGVKQYKAHHYQNAIEKLALVLKYNPKHEKALFYTAMSYRRLHEHANATNTFKLLEAVNPGYNPYFYFEAGKSFMEINDYKKAEEYIGKFLENFPDEPKTTMIKHLAKNRLVYVQKSPEVRSAPKQLSEPIPLDPINSLSNDYTPQVNPMGDKLYFTSVRKGGFDNQSDPTKKNDWGQDIYVSRRQNGQWGKPQLLPPPINSMESDFGSSFTGDGQTMVYVRCGDKQTIGGCDLFITHLTGTAWAEPVNMGNVVNSSAWDSQPTISSDGTKIIFSSTRKGGYGGSDLYMTEKNHLGDWGIPQNLGSTVNTPLDDKSPYIASDGKTLYYASEGHPGFGGLDIFYCLFDKGKWSTPINLGAPLNSAGDDKYFSISASGNAAYFAASRYAEGDDDIFQIELPDHLKPKPSVVVQGVVSNANTSEPLEAVVLVEDIETGDLVALNKSNGTSGEYVIVLPIDRNYSVSASKDGYFFYSQSFELPRDTSFQEMIKNIQLEPIEKGTKVVLNNIFFESGKAELKPISYVELNKAVELLNNNGTMVVEVGGHTDNVGSDVLNQKLSQSRAKAVVDYLVLAGIEASRLQAKGYGESTPIASNDTSEGRKANRRTEFIILEF